MSAILLLVPRLALWVLLAPLLPGIINRVKAWVAGRRGPPVLQLYYDLARLWLDVGALGEKNRLCTVSPSPVWLLPFAIMSS